MIYEDRLFGSKYLRPFDFRPPLVSQEYIDLHHGQYKGPFYVKDIDPRKL